MKRGMNKVFFLCLTFVFLIGVVSAWSVDITSPTNGSYFGAKPNSFSWSFSGIDSSNLSSNLEYNVNGNVNYGLTINSNQAIGSSQVIQGWNTIILSITNITGQTENATIQFWVDSISPILAVLNPLGNIGYTNTNILNLVVQLNETNKGGYIGFSGLPDSSNKYIWRQFIYPGFSGSEQGSYVLNSSNVSDASLTPSVLEEGKYTFNLKARDKYPNGSTIREITETGFIIRDTLQPITFISSPSTGLYYSGIINIISSAIDDTSVTTDVSEVNNITINVTDGLGYSQKFSSISSPLNYGWNSTQAPDGIYIIEATSYDRAGNQNTTQITIAIDNTKPIGTATLGTPTIYDGDLIQEVIITYDETMNNLIIPTITFTGNIGAATSNGDGTWDITNTIWIETFTITDANEETLGVSVSSSDAQDLVGNVEDVSISDIFDIDTKNPTLIITSLETDPTNANPISATATFSEDVTGFDISDLIITNGIAGNFVIVNSFTYSFDITPIADGLVTVDINGAVAQDLAGNDNVAAVQFGITYDITAPTLIITSLETDPTNANPISATATFSEDVTGFDISDLIITNGIAGNFVIVNSFTYSFDITPIADGLVTVDINGAVAQDLAGNDNNPAVQFSIIYDGTVPTVTLVTISDLIITESNAGGQITINVDYSEPMNTGIMPVITLTNNIVASGTLKFNLGSWIDVDTYQEIYDVADVNEEVIDVDVTIDSAQDLAGNSQISYNEVDAIDVDTIAPVVSINSLLTNDQSPELTGTIDDISAIIQITVDGNNYIAANNGDGTWTLLDNTIFPLLADGTYEIIISTTDLAGNVGNDVTTNELEIDTTPPTLLNIQTTNIGTSSATITWTTNENANSSVYYWTTLPASLTGSATFETAHSISLSSLSASTLYYYNVTGCDAAGNCITSTQYNFTTSDIGNGNGESGGSSGGGGGGGGSSSAKYYTCSKWNEWSACNNNQQTRICLEKIITTSQKGIIESKFNATEIQPCTASALIPLSNPAGEKSRSNEISPIEKTPGFFGRITGAITGAATGLTKSKGGKISLIVIGVLALAWLLLALGRRMNREDIGRKIKIIHKSDLVKKI